MDLRSDLDTVIDALGQAAAADGPETVELGALATLAQAIADGNAGVARIPGKHGGAQRIYGVVTVLVPDAPGELARLLTEVGEAGVNLEDLHLEHAAGRPVGMAEISVLPGSVEHLEAELDGPRMETGELSRAIVVAIDGPSGSGKSSVSRGVASALGLAYLDTGAMYRAATWWCLHQGRAADRRRRGRRDRCGRCRWSWASTR